MLKGKSLLLLLSLEQGFVEEQFLFEGKAAMFGLSCCYERTAPGLQNHLGCSGGARKT